MDETDAEVAQIMSFQGNEEPSGSGEIVGTSSMVDVDDLECASGEDFEAGAGHRDTENNLDRATLFAKGVAFERNGKPAYALKCYMDCLKGLTDGTSFSKLPQCLHRIADIYYEDKQYEKALQFIQAEKLYYEKALIDLGDLLTKSDGDSTLPNVHTESAVAESDNHLVNKADEYERLARLCLEDQKPHLALEYCGKATKIRQSVFGDGHPVTLQTLELFTSVYAEVGRLQYCDAMKRYTNGSADRQENQESEENAVSQIVHTEEVPLSSGSMNEETNSDVKSIEKSSKIGEESSEKSEDVAGEKNGSDVTDEEFALPSQSWSTKMLLVYFILTLVLAVILTMLWCDYGGSDACPSSKLLFQRVRFYLRHYFRRGLST